jgi:hypothetical protein
VSHKRLLELEIQLKTEVAKLLTLGEQADQGEVVLPDTFVVEDEIAIRQKRLEKLGEAKRVLEARARERYAAEQAEYEAKLREREEKARRNSRKPRGPEPKPPKAGPRDTDQYNFTDPDSRIMKNSTNDGFDQHYNAQAAVDQSNMLIVATSLSNHPNDKQEALPTLDAISLEIGKLVWSSGVSNLTLLLAANRTTKAWRTCLTCSRNHHLQQPAPKKRWLTSCVLRSDMPFIACANAPWNQSSVSSKKSWGSASFPYAV